MLPISLILDLAKMWAERQALKKLLEYASDPRPDIQFDMPIVGGKVDIWIRSEPTPPPTEKKARRANKITVGGRDFWLFYKLYKGTTS